MDHEKLDVYQCALRFEALAFKLLEHLPRGHAELSSLPCSARCAADRTGNEDAHAHAHGYEDEDEDVDVDEVTGEFFFFGPTERELSGGR